jgi:hypothetical protein
LSEQDISNDELINAADRMKLCTWYCAHDTDSAGATAAAGGVGEEPSTKKTHYRVISDEALEPVLSSEGIDFGTDSSSSGSSGDGGASVTPTEQESEGRGSVATDQQQQHRAVRDACNLIRWCLTGPISGRPSVEQVLSHRFLSPDATRPADRPMRYAAFLSHAQADASGTANTLYFAYAKLGLTCWIDMRQHDLTLQGMRQGVRDSDVFLMILSERLLLSWYCQQELLCAIEHNKPIQIVLEVESRFHPFRLDVWKAKQQPQQAKAGGAAAGEAALSGSERHIAVANRRGEIEQRPVSVSCDERNIWQAAQGREQLTELLCATIDENLPNAVAYRRRDFEQEAMLRELCVRNGVVLPSSVRQEDHQSSESAEQYVGAGGGSGGVQGPHGGSPKARVLVATPSIRGLTLGRRLRLPSDLGAVSDRTTTRVFVIHSSTGAHMLADIEAGFKEATASGRVSLLSSVGDSNTHFESSASILQRGPLDLADTHSRYLLLLSDGVLTERGAKQQSVDGMEVSFVFDLNKPCSDLARLTPVRNRKLNRLGGFVFT